MESYIIRFMIPMVLMCPIVTCIEIRLSDGPKPSQGRLETQGGPPSAWGELCGDGWDYAKTRVACRQLGFPGAVTYFPNNSTYFGIGSGDVYDSFVGLCNGDEEELLFCSLDLNVTLECSHDHDVALICQDFGYIGCYSNDGDVSLVAGQESLDAEMNKDMCVQSCADADYQYAAMLGERCACITSLFALTQRDSGLDCSQPCPGDPLQSCGGTDAQTVEFYTVFGTNTGICDVPVPPTDGRVSFTTTTYGSRIEFQCDDGFELRGSASLQCLANATYGSGWSEDFPRCIEEQQVTLGVALLGTAVFLIITSLVCAICRSCGRKPDTPQQPIAQPLHQIAYNPGAPHQHQTQRVHHVAQAPARVNIPVPPAAQSPQNVPPSPRAQPLATPSATAQPRATPTPTPQVQPRGTSTEPANQPTEAASFEELPQYNYEPITDDSALVFERDDDAEYSYEYPTPTVPGSGGRAPGQRPPVGDTTDDQVYLEVNASHEYLDVIPDEAEHDMEYTYIDDTNSIDRRPELPVPLPSSALYDDTHVQPFYGNEHQMPSRPHRPDMKQ